MKVKRPIDQLAGALNVIDSDLKLMNGMPTRQLAVLVDVARHPNTTMNDIASRLNMAKSSTSRALAALGRTSWTKKPGLSLITKEEGSREKPVRLTQKGQALINRIEACFELA